MGATTRRLIPPADDMTEAVVARLAHHDVADLTPEQAWAEAELLTSWLATAIFQGERPRYFAADQDISDQSWARERLKRLRSAMNSRRAA